MSQTAYGFSGFAGRRKRSRRQELQFAGLGCSSAVNHATTSLLHTFLMCFVKSVEIQNTESSILLLDETASHLSAVAQRTAAQRCPSSASQLYVPAQTQPGVSYMNHAPSELACAITVVHDLTLWLLDYYAPPISYCMTARGDHEEARTTGGVSIFRRIGHDGARIR